MMTDIQTVNPYWDEVKDRDIEQSLMHSIHLSIKDYEESIWHKRHDYCRKYTWAVPDPASLAFVAQYLAPRAIEIGAGMGYWAWQLTQLGVDMVCYDIAPPDVVTNNTYHSPRTDKYGDFTDTYITPYARILQGGPEVLTAHSDRTLFLCWPPMSDMAAECLRHYTGKRLIYIGEGDGGCTADEQFFTFLAQEWKEIAEHTPVQWDGIHDYITVYERITARGTGA